MLSLHQIKSIISEFSGMGGEVLEISGGEPLMCPYLAQIVEYAEVNNLETVLYTSGTSLGGDIAKKLQRSGLKKVIFNLQGATSDTHETVTQVKGSFGKVVDAIKTMKMLRFWVGAHFVPMKPNYKELVDLLRLCHLLRVDEVGILRFVPQGRGQTNRAFLELSREEFKDFTKRLIELTSNHKNPNIRVGRPIDFRYLLDPSVVKSECNAGISRCLITPDGRVVPCPAFKQTERYVAGNVKFCSLVDIWNKSPIWKEFRHFEPSRINEPCKSCEYLHECRGGCIAQRILKYKECDEYKAIYAAPDPGCFRFTIPVAAIGSLSIRVQE